ncbi:MAG: biopolymer transporter ExbD [Acidobacteria bacterium]|nr:biopolymer transporter ExbD [Acidobacteriota bacterium]MBV9477739.1 biopolymer transporter ExbD [Acidobacteriota bacterium]
MHAEINVTPLVDVCLVLLIIFMVVLPSMVNGTVELPETTVTAPVAERALPITVKEDGTVYLDTLIIRRDEVDSALEQLHTTAAARPIALRADKRVRYGEVVTVLAACRKAGWDDVALVSTNPAARQP